MLNCTDVLCILHEHHYYHHNHQHHLQDSRQHHDHQHHDVDHTPHAMAETEDVSDVIQGLLNATDSELSSLSHLDAPSDSVYMIFGVLIAMVLVGLIIVLLAVTISKLRKREENATPRAAAPSDVVLHSPPPTSSTTTTTPAAVAVTPAGAATPEQPPPPPFLGLWQQPSSQYLASTDKETLVQPVPVDGPKLCRGIRKNLSGRWKRLTKKKPTNEVYKIPADLRDQLKSIYVY